MNNQKNIYLIKKAGKKYMNIESYEKLKQMDIRTVPIEVLVDIDEVKIDLALPKTERLKEFLRQIKNPFCYKCNGMIVKSVYDDSGDRLEERLVGLFMTMSGIV